MFGNMGIKARPKNAISTATDANDLESFASELGREALQSAKLSRDYHFYRREKNLNLADLPHHYWDSVYKRRLREQTMKSAPHASEDERAALLETLKAVYLRAWGTLR